MLHTFEFGYQIDCFIVFVDVVVSKWNKFNDN